MDALGTFEIRPELNFDDSREPQAVEEEKMISSLSDNEEAK